MEKKSNERIRPYLANYPFKPENIEIRIFLFNSDGSSIEPEKLVVISMLDGVLQFKVHSKSKFDYFPLAIVYEETYEEAAEILSSTLKRL